MHFLFLEWKHDFAMAAFRIGVRFDSFRACLLDEFYNQYLMQFNAPIFQSGGARWNNCWLFLVFKGKTRI